jgi:hypothetical protein
MNDWVVIRSPSEVTVDADGVGALLTSILARAGINPGERLLAHSDDGGKSARAIRKALSTF